MAPDRWVERVREGLCAHLEAHVPSAVAARLLSFACRNLPHPDGEPTAWLSPPSLALRVAVALELPEPLTVGLGVVSALYFAAADVADDCAEGAAVRTVGLDLNDTCRLLFLLGLAIRALPLPAERRLALADRLERAGLVMAEGQEADLLGTNAIDAEDPLAIAWRKAGGEIGALLSLPAVAAGRPPAPFERFGQALGVLLQVVSDYLDLFLFPQSEDWQDGKPTLPIRTGLAHPAHGPALRALLAGTRTDLDRQALGRWHLIQAGAGVQLAALLDRLTPTLTASAEEAGAEVLTELAQEALGVARQVVSALGDVADDPAPFLSALPEELLAAQRQAWRFLDAPHALEETFERHRWGFFGRDEVVGDLFGPLWVVEVRRALGQDVGAAVDALLARADADGFRYYPGLLDFPTDADDTGLALALASRVGKTHAALEVGVAHLLANQTAEGLFPAWLASERLSRDDIDTAWHGGVCPISAGNALLGLSLYGVPPERLTAGAAQLGRWFIGQTPPSAFYGPVAVDALGLGLLLDLQRIFPFEALLQGAERAAERLRARQTLSGHFGTTLETALAAHSLARAGHLDSLAPTLRALIDAQEADGGYPADPLFGTVGPHRRLAQYGSRVLTTALVARALARLGARLCRDGTSAPSLAKQ